MIGRAWISPRFVTVEEAIAFHAIAVREHGGDAALLDVGKLEGAVNQVRQSVGGEFAYAYPFEMAAVYAHGIAMAHPFADGNKRAALACSAGFLRLNGWNLISEGEAAASKLLGLIAGEVTRDGMSSWLHEHSRQRPSVELREFFRGVSTEVLADWIHAFAASSGDEEGAQSIREASHAIPAVQSFDEAVDRALAAGDQKTTAMFAGTVFTLTALVRIAEDRGYEW